MQTRSGAGQREAGGGDVTRRRGAVVAGGAAGGLLLAACAGAERGPAGADAGGTARTRTPVKLSTNIQSPASTQWVAYEAADRAIREKHPWLTMEYLGALVLLRGHDQGGGRRRRKSLPDMLYAQGTQIQYYISNKIVVPVTPYLTRDKAFDLGDFPKVAVDMYSRGGQVYAIPYDHGAQMLWYNADLFKKSGVAPPTDRWTWDDVLDAARRLTVEAQGQWGLVNGGPTARLDHAQLPGPVGGLVGGRHGDEDGHHRRRLDRRRAVLDGPLLQAQGQPRPGELHRQPLPGG